jgi:dienelactone hydrolase
MFRTIFIAISLLVGTVAIEISYAEEIVHFSSAGTPPTPFQVKRAKAKGVEPETTPGDKISGTIRLPASDGTTPAVVMLHSCRGAQPYLQNWAEYLTGIGIVTLVVDSYLSRGIADECNNLHGSSDQSSDAYGALQYLASLDVVDGDRVGLLGWGQSPLVGSMELNGVEQFYKLKFRAAVGFYVNCAYFTEGKVYAPTLLLIAGKDDWSKPGRCANSVKAGQQNGSPISMVEYPDAFHGFDDSSVGKQLILDVRNLYKNPAFGATLKYSNQVHEDAKNKVKQFLNEHFSFR